MKNKKPNELVLEWRVDPPRRRSVVIGDRPRRVELKRPTVTLFIRDSTATGYYPRFAAWATDDGELRRDSTLLIHPFHTPDEEMSHVYANGVVCFDPATDGKVMSGGLDPWEAFWGSDMSVLPSWMTSVGDVRVDDTESRQAINWSTDMEHVWDSDRRAVVVGSGEVVEEGPVTPDDVMEKIAHMVLLGNSRNGDVGDVVVKVRFPGAYEETWPLRKFLDHMRNKIYKRHKK